jgi:hypothetical protein
LLKAWPELLVASVALHTSRIHFLNNGKTKTIAHPEKSLKSFILYYLRCSHSLSPLIPNWADGLLRRGPAYLSPQGAHEDPIAEWMFPRLETPNPERLCQEWEWLREIFADLIALYPERAKKETHAEI